MSLIRLVTIGLVAPLALGGCAGLANYGAMMNQPATPAGGSGAPASAPASGETTAPTEAAASEKQSGPTSVSVTIRNTCGETVKIFYGDKPKFGSGTYSTASGNSSMSHTFRPGDSFWIVDDHENGVANVTVEEGTHQIEIGSDCSKLAAR
jgi:hypothetical protein